MSIWRFFKKFLLALKMNFHFDLFFPKNRFHCVGKNQPSFTESLYIASWIVQCKFKYKNSNSILNYWAIHISRGHKWLPFAGDPSENTHKMRRRKQKKPPHSKKEKPSNKTKSFSLILSIWFLVSISQQANQPSPPYPN